MRAAHLERTRILTIIRLREVEVEVNGKMFGEHIRVPSPENQIEIEQTGSFHEVTILEIHTIRCTSCSAFWLRVCLLSPQYMGYMISELKKNRREICG